MNLRKNLFLLLPIFALASCEVPHEIKPTSLKAAKDEISLILGSERNLNDIVTLIFEPSNVTNRAVIWSTDETEIFKLNGDNLITNKIGTGEVTATSVVNPDLYTNVQIKVYNPETPTYKVFTETSSDYKINNLKDEYKEGEEVSFTIELLNENKIISEVKLDEETLVPVSEFNYSFVMPKKDVTLSVLLENKSEPLPQENSEKYNIVYDLGGRKTPKLLETAEEIFNTFSYAGTNKTIINNVSEFEYIYGGGSGGRASSGNNWYAGDMLKLGTTSVNGCFTLELSTYINKVNITGYATSASAKIRIGDKSSTDWTEETLDNKTTLVECSELAIAEKTNIENKVETTISLEFEKTKSLKISTTNKKPIYITNIELIYSE